MYPFIFFGVACLAVLVVVSPLQAAGEAGAYFLKIKNSARAAALGEAFASLADDISCLQWNPAGLALLDVPVIEFNHRQYFADTRYEYLAGGLPLSGIGNLGFGLYYSTIDDLFATDDVGFATSVSAYDLYGILGYGRRVGPGLCLGANSKCYYSYLLGSTAAGVALDLGALYDFQGYLRAGISILNLGPGIKYERVADPLPRWLKLGLTVWPLNYRASALSLTGEINKALFKGPVPYLSLGAEYSFLRSYFARVGYNMRAEQGRLTYGAGLKYSNVLLNYAFVSYGVLGVSHSASLAYEFRGREGKRRESVGSSSGGPRRPPS